MPHYELWGTFGLKPNYEPFGLKPNYEPFGLKPNYERGSLTPPAHPRRRYGVRRASKSLGQARRLSYVLTTNGARSLCRLIQVLRHLPVKVEHSFSVKRVGHNKLGNIAADS
jgi:hypothetical protein